MTLYIIKNGERQGPFTIDQLVSLIRKGECLMSDLVWHERMADWQPIHSLPDIVGAVLPPDPARAEVKFTQQVTPPIPAQPSPNKPEVAANLQPTSESATTLTAPVFFYIPQSRLITMCLISTSFPLFWVYRNWSFLRSRDGLKIQPFWRGIFCLFYMHPLFEVIKNDAQTNKIAKADYSPGILAAGWIILMLTGFFLSNFSDAGLAQILGAVFTIFSFCFILPVQAHINKINESMSVKPNFNPWSPGHIVCLGVGILFWLLTLVSLLQPGTGPQQN